MTRTQRAFETLYHDHVTDVFRYALAVTGQTSDAEDVTQTTFMNAYRAYARGERPRKPQNWLLTIAHNVCRQRARFAYYRVREVELEENDAEALVPPEDVPSAADIRRALSHLPFQQRAVLIMRELEGRTHAEIAEVMGLTTAATEMLAFRARRALREQLAGSLTCTQAASALDRQLDGRLDAESAGLLRAHLRECEDCERLARRLRAQQSAWKSLAIVPLPTSLATFNHASAAAGGSAAVGGAGLGAGIAAKVASVTIAAATLGGGAYLVKLQLGPTIHPPAKARTAHVRHHAPRHAPTTRTVATAWRATPTAITQVVPHSAHAGHKGAVTHPAATDDTAPPVVTVPAVPTGAATDPPDWTQPAAADQPAQADDQPTTQVDATPTPQPGDAADTPPPAPTPEHANQGVRAHGAPATSADPNGDGPQGKSTATPPPYTGRG